MAGAHPRAGGENGERDSRRGHRVRLIPARAGKTRLHARPSGAVKAHPRAGGENHAFTEQRPGGQRLIPARAGKTNMAGITGQGTTAHPRAGGENDDAIPEHPELLGSSPRGRGKQSHMADQNSALGLIPARAGKTPLSTILDGDRAAHPRAGGENGPTSYAGNITVGSSPRGRGKHFTPRTARNEFRLIPARAGKTITG